ncbi:hypothetical protein Tcan_14883 [Toxocara canis]|uniref:Uncharacterized protein n=1 Tax=Toxocara canis TaxID=6265 RepID=A0A0B2V9J1_TOXCA|nr:hypothetical protein Tcan_14883 [Toxocara canis]
MRVCASLYSHPLCFLLSTLTASAFFQKNDRLTIQTNRFLSQIQDDFIIYGITQDCRIFFVDRSNLDLIRALRVDPRSTYCYPNLVKLHLQQGANQLALMLIMKQAGNRICTLPIEMPQLHTIANGRIFSYSILSSIPYMSCSHLPDNVFALEPDLSFMDTAFADVIYFINAKSVGSTWSVRQFQITKSGHLRAMDKLTINYPRRDDRIGYDMANQFIVELDLKRSLLYTMNRFLKNLLSECSFDLLFRPEYVKPKWIAFDRDQRRQTWLDSFSVDGDLLLFTESLREESGISANIYATDLKQPNSTVHILIVNFAADLIILKKPTLVELTARNISRFDKSLLRKMSTSTRKSPTSTNPPTRRPHVTANRSQTHEPIIARTSPQTQTTTGRPSAYRTYGRPHHRLTTTPTNFILPTSPPVTSRIIQTTEEVYHIHRTSKTPPTTPLISSNVVRHTTHLPTSDMSTVQRMYHPDESEQASAAVEGAMVANVRDRERDGSPSKNDQSKWDPFNDDHRPSVEQDEDIGTFSGADRRNKSDRDGEPEQMWNEEDKEEQEQDENSEEEDENVFQLPQNIETDEESVRPSVRPTKRPRQHTGEPQTHSLNTSAVDTTLIAMTSRGANFDNQAVIFSFLFFTFLWKF